MTQKKRERCLQEVALLQQLDHPNIIQVGGALGRGVRLGMQGGVTKGGGLSIDG